MTKICIIPECPNLAPGRARYCLDCTVAVSGDLRHQIIRLESLCNGIQVQSDYVRVRARLAAKLATAWAISQRRRDWQAAQVSRRERVR